MNCPNCGAAGLELLPGRTHLRCPYCTSLVFPEPLDEGVVPLDRPHPDDCPACRRPLAAAALDGEVVGYCSTCRGMLLSTDHFARVVARRRGGGPPRTLTPEPVDPRELRRARNCPRCRRRVETHVYGGGGNAVIDSCERCRLVWLDAGELTMLVRHVPERATIRTEFWDERSAAPLEEILRAPR
jgi:Zn-finger nucleic acid-binding protein